MDDHTSALVAVACFAASSVFLDDGGADISERGFTDTVPDRFVGYLITTFSPLKGAANVVCGEHKSIFGTGGECDSTP